MLALPIPSGDCARRCRKGLEYVPCDSAHYSGFPHRLLPWSCRTCHCIPPLLCPRLAAPPFNPYFVTSGYQPQRGQASALVPLVYVIWVAVAEPSAWIKKISLLTSQEHGERRGVLPVKAVKPIHALSGLHMALLRPEAALPLFLFVVTRMTARGARVREYMSSSRRETPP